MHDIRWIRDNPVAFDKALAARGLAPDSGRLIALDEKRRELIAELQGLQERRNAATISARRWSTLGSGAGIFIRMHPVGDERNFYQVRMGHANEPTPQAASDP